MPQKTNTSDKNTNEDILKELKSINTQLITPNNKIEESNLLSRESKSNEDTTRYTDQLIRDLSDLVTLLDIEVVRNVCDQCDITKGDCVADNEKEENNCNKSTCFRKPDSCKDYGDVDLFGKNQKYQCHCKHLSDCQFQIRSKCKNGCLPGFKEPYCQKRKYHEFIKNESSRYSNLFSSDNKRAKKPQIVINFRNTYRFSTVEIYSNFTGCPPQLYGKDCINECHCSRAESCHQITGKCEGNCEDGWYGEKCDMQTYVNIAEGKQTNQSSTYGEKGTLVFFNGTCMDRNVGMTSDKAVDGNFDPGVTHKSCAHTEKERNPFWQVTFDKPYKISQLRIYNRMKSQCVPGFYGDMCKEHSCELCERSKCDKVTGRCEEGCIIGYYVPYGSQKCKEKTTKNILVSVLVPLLLFVILAMGTAAAIWCRKKKQIAKRGKRIRKTSENLYSQAIPYDAAHIYEDIQMKESEGVYINKDSSSSHSYLLNYVAQKKQEVEPYNDEFLRLPQTLPMPYTEATKPENTRKNLHNFILPYDHSRVKLQPDEISSSDYINANFINNQRYIACQGPTQSTLTDFWRMIWQLKCNTIIALNDTITAGKMKCMQYWPDEENNESFGTIQISHIKTMYHSTYIHRSFTISKVRHSIISHVI
ncbi:receptor-type tyrosine-protein phosphatase T-like [Octopus vulgaris]|uniref:protein-tyrosine-phosphatase n=1 Tax=Octopus vulgaris TaxID=6645 RepID=A0AA36BGS3_OCTVU|nr:receptor-type tyrosine-protein phosphatase T-like [Octopus vulgaris]